MTLSSTQADELARLATAPTIGADRGHLRALRLAADAEQAATIDALLARTAPAPAAEGQAGHGADDRGRALSALAATMTLEQAEADRRSARVERQLARLGAPADALSDLVQLADVGSADDETSARAAAQAVRDRLPGAFGRQRQPAPSGSPARAPARMSAPLYDGYSAGVSRANQLREDHA